MIWLVLFYLIAHAAVALYRLFRHISDNWPWL